MSTGNQTTRNPNIPAEILLLIASFVPPKDLWSLYGVNKILSEVALNHRYSSLLLDLKFSPSGVLADQLRQLRHLNRVVSLTIDPTPLCCLPDDGPTMILPAGKGFENKPLGWFVHTRRRLLTAIGLLDNAKATAGFIQRLTNVSSLSIGSVGRKSWPHLSTIANTAWNTFGPMLTTLRLNIAPALLDGVLHDSLFLPKLATFEFAAFPRLFNESPIQVASIIVPFLNRHKETLDTLEFSFWWTVLNAAIFFDDLRHMPHLRSFSFHSMHYPADPTAIHRWLAMHSADLLDLRLQLSGAFPDRERRFLQGLTFSHLKRLSLTLSWGPPDPSALSFVQRHSHSLRSFWFQSPDLNQGELVALLDCFPPSIDQNLEFLSLTPNYLTPAMLDVLAERFPELVELNISALEFHHQVCAVETTTNCSTNQSLTQFCAEMRGRSYTDWKLRHLSVGESLRHQVQGCGALALALPNICTVGDSSRTDCLEKLSALVLDPRGSVTD